MCYIYVRAGVSLDVGMSVYLHDFIRMCLFVYGRRVHVYAAPGDFYSYRTVFADVR